MKKVSNKEYWLDRNLAVACVNADTSGLNEDDIKALEEIQGHIIIINDDIEFRRCDITGLGSDCVKVIEEIYN